MNAQDQATAIPESLTRKRHCINRVEYKGDVETCALDGTECAVCRVLPLLDEMGMALETQHKEWSPRSDCLSCIALAHWRELRG